ncbi:hypothetical protein DI005_18335 [Prauserella sp. PE36]|uniref:hypothetical protein n=1 Tax=Prauserella sp. PE36 TaxID=1504709 RepID=UPI000DE44D1A|nr:hypothetical protein [Prauserella sp. PE36]RBM18653.1 hypothetical protein DI005_18335 [Prauserella sp. PE36]
MAADAIHGARVRRHADTGAPLIRDPPEEYVGQHRFILGDDNPTMPPEFLFPLKDDLPSAATAYLPRVGRLGAEPAYEARDGDLAIERAAATRAIRHSSEPNLAFLQRVLDGLQRM